MRESKSTLRWLLKSPLEVLVSRLLAPVDRLLAPVGRFLSGAEARVTPFWRPILGIWMAVTGALLALRFVALRSDFPVDKIGRRFVRDGFLFTDEGWYSAGALRWFRTGEWYVDGDMNLGVVLPVQQVLHVISFAIFGVGIEAARLTTVFSFLAMCALTYYLIRRFEARWVGLVALWVLATNFFFFTHSRIAISENPMMMFIMGSALLATYANGARAWWLSPIVGVVFVLGVLTKTPCIIFAPIIAIGLMFRNWPGGWRITAAMLGAPALFSVVVLGGYFAWSSFSKATFPVDVAYFHLINSGQRSELNVYRWYEHGSWFLRNLHYIDRVLFQYVLYGVPALLLLNKRFRSSPLVIASIAAIVIYFVSFSIYGNRQFRYFAALAAPLSIVVAMGVSALWEARSRGTLLRLAFLAMVVAVFVSGGRGVSSLTRQFTNLEYTFSNEAARIHALIEEHDLPNNVLLGHISCTFALYEDFIPINDLYETGPLEERLLRWQPHMLVTEYPLEPYTWQPVLEKVDGDPRDSVARLRILQEYGRIEHLGPVDLLKSNNERDTQLYRLFPSPTPAISVEP